MNMTEEKPHSITRRHSMDNEPLSKLLQTMSYRQFWIKPVGNPDLPVDEHKLYSTPTIRIDFATNPVAVKTGDILIVYRIKVSKLLYVAEALSAPFNATDEEIKREPWRERWSWIIEARNLTPEYGGRWSKYSLKPFSLAKEYNQENPPDEAKIGGLKFGSDKLRISQDFGRFLVNKIMQLGETSV
jgi:hypothetical protein